MYRKKQCTDINSCCYETIAEEIKKQMQKLIIEKYMSKVTQGNLCQHQCWRCHIDMKTYLVSRMHLVIHKIIRQYTSIMSNSNWTEWSTIQGVIGQVISKSYTYNCTITSTWHLQLYNYGSNQGCWWPIRFENFDIVMIITIIIVHNFLGANTPS